MTKALAKRAAKNMKRPFLDSKKKSKQYEEALLQNVSYSDCSIEVLCGNCKIATVGYKG